MLEHLEQDMQAATVAAASGSAANAHASPVGGAYSAQATLPAPPQLPTRTQHQPAAASGATPADGSVQPMGRPTSGPESALLAQLPGGSAEEKLSAAVAVIANMQREVEELRSRNRALAQDLVQATSSTAASAGGSKTPPAGSELEARVQAQLRASRAEMEVGALRCVSRPRCRRGYDRDTGGAVHAACCA
jgi:hypothetical protein